MRRSSARSSRLVGVSQFVEAQHQLVAAGAAVQQRVAAGEVDPKRRRIGQPRDAAGPQRRHQQPEPGDGHGVGVEVHAVHAVQGPLDKFAIVRAGLGLAASGRGAGGSARAGSARCRRSGRSCGSLRPSAELVDGRIERAVEDELLDELRRLQQGVLLAGRLGEVLVQVAQEPRVPVAGR